MSESLIQLLASVFVIVTLIFMDGTLWVLFIVALDARTGGTTEVFCSVLYHTQNLILFAYLVYCCWTQMRQFVRKPALLVFSITSGLNMLGCMVITARAARAPGLLPEFGYWSSGATAVVVLSWLAVLVALVALLATYFSKLFEDPQQSALPRPPRVRFHEVQDQRDTIASMPPAYSPPRQLKTLSCANDAYTNWTERRLRPFRLSRGESKLRNPV